VINEEITMHLLDTLREKTTQAQTQAKELTEKFQTLIGAVEEALNV
jgi:hypothetical protein